MCSYAVLLQYEEESSDYALAVYRKSVESQQGPITKMLLELIQNGEPLSFCVRS